MTKLAGRYFFLMATLGALLAAVTAYQVIVTSPAVIAAIQFFAFSAVGVGVVALFAALAAGLFFLWGWGQRFRIDVATKAGQSVTVHHSGDSFFAINPLGLEVQAWHLNPNRFITTSHAEAGQIENLRWLAYTSRNQKVVNQLNEIMGELPPPAWPLRVNLSELLTAGRGDINRIVLGITLDEQSRQLPVTVSLEDMVHGALGGETGTGKSSLAYSMAYQLATAPQDVSLVLADPAGTTWKTFSKSPRLAHPIISDEHELLHALKALLAECERRTEKLFAPYPTVEKLSEYNALVGPDQQLGYTVVMIDEFPEYMENKEVEQVFRRLIRKSRKAGIFLFAMGTSWKATDMDSAIKRQFRTKVHFAASDKESSRVLLGDSVAETLRDPGRAYARLPFGTSADLIEIQCGYLDKADVIQQMATRPAITARAAPLFVADFEDEAPPVVADNPPDLDPSKPNDEEQKVIESYVDLRDFEPENFSYNEVSRRVWGNTGGAQTRKIKEILAKFGIEPV